MKLNPDCIRDILIFAENIEYNKECTINAMHSSLSNYSEEELDYTCIKLEEAGYLEASFVSMPRHVSKVTARIQGLTWEGHKFLSDIRINKVWSKLKDTLLEKGLSGSMTAIASLAPKIVENFIK
ncbi:DUF2513 domain-containing protein [Peptostreptococcus faecalis]|uniref:DUF2513 domain-containing protein n=1 Tax=Peptostreptococcus faecalis TaxID=2045015 RepID=UPI000C7BABF5|nr:DUF2513 domain-containing protein [Peptostreptococcus faecalis]